MPSGGASLSICETVSWKAAGPSSPIHSASPSSTACRTGRRAHRGDDPRQRVRDLVEVARVDADLVAAAMDLDADPVELPLDRRALEARDRVGHALGGRGEHREDRPEELEADAAKPLLALRVSAISAVRVRSPESISARRASAPRHAGRLRDRVDHQPGERALPQLAGEQPLDEVGLLARSRGRGGRRGSACARAAEPLPVVAWTRRSRGRDRRSSATAPRPARARSRRSSSSRRRRGPAGARPTRKPTAIGTSPGSSRPSSSARIATFARARARLGDLARGGDDVGEQGHGWAGS